MRHSTTILGLGALCSAIVCTVAAADPSGATTSDRAREASLHAAPVGQARLIRVRTTIQAAVDTAKPGDVVLVPAGTYHENVVVSTDGVSLVGLTGAVLDGAGVAGSIGVRVAPPATAATLREFSLQGLRVEGYARDGVLLRHVDGFTIVGNSFVDNGD